MICWDRVNELRDEVGPEDFLEVVEIFLEEVDEIVDRLHENPTPDTYESDLHFLKGSALNLGFDGFAKLCGDGENMARDGAPANISITRIIELYRTSKSVFLNERESRTAA